VEIGTTNGVEGIWQGSWLVKTPFTDGPIEKGRLTFFRDSRFHGINGISYRIWKLIGFWIFSVMTKKKADEKAGSLRETGLKPAALRRQPHMKKRMAKKAGW